jgi:hypothetical protein
LTSKAPFSSGVNFWKARIWPNTKFCFPNDRNSIRISFNVLSVAKYSRRIVSDHRVNLLKLFNYFSNHFAPSCVTY